MIPTHPPLYVCGRGVYCTIVVKANCLSEGFCGRKELGRPCWRWQLGSGSSLALVIVLVRWPYVWAGAVWEMERCIFFNLGLNATCRSLFLVKAMELRDLDFGPSFGFQGFVMMEFAV